MEKKKRPGSKIVITNIDSTLWARCCTKYFIVNVLFNALPKPLR